MPQVIVTVGLPGSGKTTWAEQYVNSHDHIVRVNKDTIRAMLYAGREWTRTQEEFVCNIRDENLCSALTEGYSVIIDDTNLDSKHIMRIQTLVGLSPVHIQDFTDVPLDVCLERNRNRTDKKPLHDETILMMHRKYFENGKWKYCEQFIEEQSNP